MMMLIKPTSISPPVMPRFVIIWALFRGNRWVAIHEASVIEFARKKIQAKQTALKVMKRLISRWNGLSGGSSGPFDFELQVESWKPPGGGGAESSLGSCGFSVPDEASEPCGFAIADEESEPCPLADEASEAVVIGAPLKLP